MIRFAILLAALAAACGGAEAAVGGRKAAADWSKAVPWTTYQGTNTRSGYMPVTIDTAVFKLRWSKSLRQSQGVFPVVEGGGNVYVAPILLGNAQNALIALNISDGAEKWRAEVPFSSGFFPPTYAAGVVYLQPEGTLWAFDAATGTKRYSVAVNSASYFGIAVDGQTLYIGCGLPSTRGVCARRASNGESLWSQPTNFDDLWAPVLSNGVVYAYTAGGSVGDPVDLRAFNAADGQPLFKVVDADPNFGERPDVSALGSLHDLIVTEGGRLVSFDLEGHKINWVVPDENEGPVAVAKGVVYTFGLADGVIGVEALNESDGKLLWIWPSPDRGEFTGQLGLVVTDNILFASTTRATHAVDLATHDEVWAFPAAGRLALSSEGVLFIGEGDGTLAAITVK